MATYKDFDDFLPEILIQAQGCPTQLAIIQIRNAVIKFLERTLVLKTSPSTFYLDEDEPSYTLKFANDRYRAVALKEVRLASSDTDENYTQIHIVSEHELDETITKWRVRQTATPTHCFLTEETNVIRFYPMPNTDSTKEIYIDAAVTIKKSETSVIDWVWEKFEEAIVAGALSVLLGQNGASWNNPEESAKWGRTWKRMVMNARSQSLKGVGEQAGRVQPQEFGGSPYGNTYGGYTTWV
jgi:hypothetical protein